MTSIKHKIIFDQPYWCIPSVESAFNGFFEGAPTDEDKSNIIKMVLQDREKWRPSQDAWMQFEEVKRAIGQEVEIQMWDSIMFMLEKEGPYPILAKCTGITLEDNEDGKQQAYLKIENVRNKTTPMGFDGRSRLKDVYHDGIFLMPLAEIYSINWETKNSTDDCIDRKERNFTELVLNHLSSYKKDVLGIIEDGIYMRDGKPRSHILPTKFHYLNILPEYRKLFFSSGYSKITYHKYFHHLNSSQAMCINLFFPLIAEGTLNLITEYLRIPGGFGLQAIFEKVSELEDATRKTNFDFHLKSINTEYTDIFFEVKYTENGFGKSKLDQNHIDKFQKTYLPLLKNSKYLNKVCQDQIFFFTNYQLIRNLVHIEKNKRVVFLLPSKNSKSWKEANAAYHELLNENGRLKVNIVSLEEFVTFLEKESNNVSLGKYYSEFRRKYLI